MLNVRLSAQIYSIDPFVLMCVWVSRCNRLLSLKRHTPFSKVNNRTHKPLRQPQYTLLFRFGTFFILFVSFGTFSSIGRNSDFFLLYLDIGRSTFICLFFLSLSLFCFPSMVSYTGPNGMYATSYTLCFVFESTHKNRFFNKKNYLTLNIWNLLTEFFSFFFSWLTMTCTFDFDWKMSE